MPPRIAIPMPHSSDREYGERAIPQYERAVSLVGGDPVRIPLDRSLATVRQLIGSCEGVLLPGSNADVDPARFQQDRSQHTAMPDARREDVDFFLLDDAYAQHKPVLGICYGLQSLNVYRAGSLIQHILDFLPAATRGRINHEAGRKVAIAHTAKIDSDSLLARVVGGNSHPRPSAELELGASKADFREGHALSHAEHDPHRSGASTPEGKGLILPVNSSHHQSADKIGAGLRIAASCPDDGIIEALEGTSPNHFVLAVQWHPERSVDDDDASRNIFRAFIEAAQTLA